MKRARVITHLSSLSLVHGFLVGLSIMVGQHIYNSQSISWATLIHYEVMESELCPVSCHFSNAYCHLQIVYSICLNAPSHRLYFCRYSSTSKKCPPRKYDMKKAIASALLLAALTPLCAIANAGCESSRGVWPII